MIGIFDSGIGGLSVWRELYRLMPEQDYIYFADSKHCPYGDKPLSFIQQRADEISRFLIEKGANMVVVACNTATAAAIKMLREKYTEVEFVGIEPATSLAAKLTESKVVGVLATESTLKSDKYRETLFKISPQIRVLEKAGASLVGLVESGELSGEHAILEVKPYIEEFLNEGVDTLVLGCTHYPFLGPVIAEIAGPKLKVIDPAVHVAARAQYILNLTKQNINPAKNLFYTNGDFTTMKILVEDIIPGIDEDSFVKI